MYQRLCVHEGLAGTGGENGDVDVAEIRDQVAEFAGLAAEPFGKLEGPARVGAVNPQTQAWQLASPGFRQAFGELAGADQGEAGRLVAETFLEQSADGARPGATGAACVEFVAGTVTAL